MFLQHFFEPTIELKLPFSSMSFSLYKASTCQDIPEPPFKSPLDPLSSWLTRPFNQHEITFFPYNVVPPNDS